MKKCTVASNICTVNTWTDGGVGRLFTQEDLTGNNVLSTGDTALNPNNWVWNKVIDDVGPVTSAVARLEKKSVGLMWLYFGAGRYYFVQGSAVDDADTRRALFGIKDPCFGVNGFDTTCATTTPTLRAFCATPCSNPPTCTEPSATLCGDLTNVTNVANTPANPDDASFKGWYINLEPAANPLTRKRLQTQAAGLGLQAQQPALAADMAIARETLQTQRLCAGTIGLKESLPTLWQRRQALCSLQHSSHTPMNATSEARALSGRLSILRAARQRLY